MSNELNEIYKQMLLAKLNEQIRRKCFISYYSSDSKEVDKFLADFGDVFIGKSIGVSNGDDFIDSDDAEYVMSQIRKIYLGDSTVTICLIGKCTHSRRYIDWELKTSLRKGSYTPNGLIGILLPSMGNAGHLPPRFQDNWQKEEDSSYAIYRSYPKSKAELQKWIESAFDRRTSKVDLINNSQTMMKYNRKCEVHDETH
jgi:hypothetical protein